MGTKDLFKHVGFTLIVFALIPIAAQVALLLISPDFSQGYLINKEKVFHGCFKYGLYLHIISSPFCLFLSTMLILYPVHLKRLKLHRNLGKIYIFLVISLAAPGGLILSFFAMGGIWSKFGFGVLSILWFYFTINGWFKIKKGDVSGHQNNMTKSFLLAFSAITLRAYLLALKNLSSDWLGYYTVISWLSWIPQLLIYEIFLLTRKSKT